MAHPLRLRERLERSAAHCSLFRLDGWRRLLPGDCPLCRARAPGGALCRLCRQWLLPAERRPRCERCGLVLSDAGTSCAECERRPPAFDGIVTVFDYAAPADLLIHRFKSERCIAMAPVLGELLSDAVVARWPILPPDLVLVPVPASGRSIRQRGFNPAAEIARVLARRLQRPCRPEKVRRIRDGRRQAALGRQERSVSASRVYEVAANVQGAHIALVDDVLTTGSTLDAIARQLKRSGAQSVHGLILARTPAPARHHAEEAAHVSHYPGIA